MEYEAHTAALLRHLTIAPFAHELEQAGKGTDPDLAEPILTEFARLAENAIAPLDKVMDEVGARLVEGRVQTVPGHRAVWDQFREGGWIGLPLPEDLGGMGLNLALQTACEELLNRASPSFAMLPAPNRTAAQLLVESGFEDLAREWVPKLLSGEWGASMCISEPDAGSDVGRIRTRGQLQSDGSWRVTGEKCWISFGDHDLTARIGHLVLARSGDAPGVRGLSLFLVPDRLEDGARNGVFTRRIEEKLGLHGSPTCALGFEDARGFLISPEGRGLQTMFHMMLRMRLACAPQGVGVAAGAFAAALRYAGERRQGGPADAPPVLIRDHTDVQRMLLAMAGRIEAARGLSLACANALELGGLASEPAEQARWLTLAQFLLPIAKDMSARLAFESASEALQVFGGAGYTREWPIEKMLRDARVFAVFEGTSGIQAIDMLHRRLWREQGAGVGLFLSIARAEAGPDWAVQQLGAALAALEGAAEKLGAMAQTPREGDAGALAFLDLCGACAAGWISLRLIRDAGDDPTGERIKAAAHHYLAELPVRAGALAQLACLGASRLDGFRAFVVDE